MSVNRFLIVFKSLVNRVSSSPINCTNPYVCITCLLLSFFILYKLFSLVSVVRLFFFINVTIITSGMWTCRSSLLCSSVFRNNYSRWILFFSLSLYCSVSFSYRFSFWHQTDRFLRLSPSCYVLSRTFFLYSTRKRMYMNEFADRRCSLPLFFVI